MSVLVFETPGHIDIRAFTLMGVSAKPSTTSSIGYFGTGLKYAVASLVRMGSRPVVWIGRDRYTFFNRPDKFRGVEFDKITMRRDRLGLRGRNTDLPYTTMYGRKWTLGARLQIRHIREAQRRLQVRGHVAPARVQPQRRGLFQ